MLFKSLLSLLSLPSLILAHAEGNNTFIASWSAYYSNPAAPLINVACSNGANGLITRFNYTTVGEIPTFPYVAAGPGIGWNSTECGSVWNFTYTDPGTQESKTISAMIIDSASMFLLSRAAFEELACEAGLEAGHITVTAIKNDTEAPDC